jgi:PASTA domain
MTRSTSATGEERAAFESGYPLRDEAFGEPAEAPVVPPQRGRVETVEARRRRRWQPATGPWPIFLLVLRVIGQNPRPGANEAKDGRVRLDVSLQPLVVIPNVVGMPGITASHTLVADHLIVSRRYVPSRQPARTVIAQYPTTGGKVKRGTSVEINISTGSGPTDAGPSGPTDAGSSGPTGPGVAPQALVAPQGPPWHSPADRPSAGALELRSVS